VNNKLYIGSSKSLKQRWASHLCLLRKGTHINSYLQNSWNKYKEINFIFEIIEECSISELIIREQYWIDTLSPNYNIREKCESNAGFKHSNVTKEKISKKSKEIWKNNRQKLTETKWKSILAYDKEGNFIKECRSVKEAAKELKLSGTNISVVLKGKSITARGIHFIYKNGDISKKIIIPKRRNNGTVGLCNRNKVELWLNNKFIQKFDSKQDLAKYLNTDRSTISEIISGKYFKEHPKTKILKYEIKEIL